MVRHYLFLFRTFWLGGLWGCAYVVRPLLEHRGFFPQHGMDVMHVMVGLGVCCGVIILLLGKLYRALSWRCLPVRLLLIMTFLSLVYFALMPWWKLQMMLVHAIAALGLIWLLTAPVSVIRRDRPPAAG
ncbi:MAG: hypothetical protein LRY66_02090 [Saccharospirillaceae bacterium]|nr:hypothetical protein [Saccharospirillaceae bacterium]MCD8530154.1 hypothetical protein [Saccharospirillaceae bacterium]